ncbi:MAG: hypothetical protein RIQ52_1167 [Pseudomonadota bacterium]|jgi:ribonuclease T
MTATTKTIASRFRRFLPVVIDVETAGFDPRRHALLELAAVTVTMDDAGVIYPDESLSFIIQPHEGAEMEASALAFTGIDPYHPERNAVHERDALQSLFAVVARQVRKQQCTRAILVGHNPSFDLGFLLAAAERNRIGKHPFHGFCTLDTATMGALAYGETVLAKAAMASGMTWDNRQAHSALYDAEQTARLFCTIVNQWPLARPGAGISSPVPESP